MHLPSVEEELRGKVAFVMGGSSGIGLASATLIAQRGAAVRRPRDLRARPWAGRRTDVVTGRVLRSCGCGQRAYQI